MLRGSGKVAAVPVTSVCSRRFLPGREHVLQGTRPLALMAGWQLAIWVLAKNVVRRLPPREASLGPEFGSPGAPLSSGPLQDRSC